MDRETIERRKNMELDLFQINSDYKEKQRRKNVQEYQRKFFKNLRKSKKKYK